MITENVYHIEFLTEVSLKTDPKSDPNPTQNRFLIFLLEREDLLLYYDGETIAGHVQVDLKGAKFEHKVRKMAKIKWD